MRRVGRIRTGALSSLAACFFVSGLLRAGEVVAALPAHPAAGPRETVAQAAEQGTAGSEAASGPAPGSGPQSLGALATELQRQRADLARREAALDDRAQLLEAMEARIAERIAELRIARDRLAETAALVDDAADRDVRHLAQMYQQMKPKQAGQIFNAMAPEFAAGFLGEMGPEAAGLILANMDADKAYAVSLLLAGRNVGRD